MNVQTKTRRVSVVIALVALFASLWVFAAITSAAQKEVRFTFCCEQQDRLDFFTKVAAAYEKSHPDVKITLLGNTGGQKLRTLIAGGQTPDIMWQGFTWQGLVDIFEPVNSFLEREPGLVADLDPNMLKAFSVNGVNYGLPIGAATRVMSYNKDLLDQNGYTAPTSDWTWKDLLGIAKRLTRDTNGDGQNDIWGLSFYWWPWGMISYGGDGFNDDGTATDLDNQATLEAWRIHIDTWSGKNGLKPQGDDVNPAQVFANGKMVFYDTGIFEVPFLRDNMQGTWGVQTFPWLVTDDGRHRGTWSTGESFMVYKDSPVKPEALDFLRFLLSPEQVKEGVQAMGIVPSSRTLQSSDIFLQPDLPPINMKAFAESLAFGSAPFPGHPATPDVWSAASPILSESNSGDLPAERYQERLVETVNRVISDVMSKKGN